MNTWPKNPTIYEINTWAWSTELSKGAHRQVSLKDIPQAALEKIAGYGFDGVWLMGVWRRSPGARQIALTYPAWQASFQQALPDYTTADVVGSPYAVLDYHVDPTLGGDDGLAMLRRRLESLGLRLILDFVPNHMALDHAWLKTNPETFVQGDADLLNRQPQNYFRTQIDSKERIFAHGRDPYFDGWPDTVQLDYRSPATRRAMADILLSIAERCDGVRCDMSMLLTNEVFRRTWGGEFNPPAVEFWPAAMTDVKAKFPGFLTMAEVYWDMEWTMQQQGFDYTYDKRLYDRLLHENAGSVHEHLAAGLDYQAHLARFIENHDEPRAAQAFGIERSKVAALVTLTLPGLRLLHEGQLEGRKVKLPVHLGRRMEEEPVEGMEPFYRRLLGSLQHPIFHVGTWQRLNPAPAFDGNPGYQNALAHCWEQDDHVRLVAANLSDSRSQFHLPLEAPMLAGKQWKLIDLMNDREYERAGDEMLIKGLSIDLPGYGYHLFEFIPA